MTTIEEAGVSRVDLDVAVASVQVRSGRPGRAVVHVAPGHPDDRDDVAAAEQTTVVRSGNRIAVVSRHGRRALRPWRDGGSVRVEVELPAGSDVTGRIERGGVALAGRLGGCRLTLGACDLDVEEVDAVRIRVGSGSVVIGRAGSVDVASGSGDVRLDRVEGSAVVKVSAGAVRIGSLTGSLRVHSANGAISIDEVDGSLAAKAARGDVRIGCVRGGAIVAETGFGRVDLGLGEGCPAYLDLRTGSGAVSTDLEETERPRPGERAAQVRARTGFGDITVHRCGAVGGRPPDAGGAADVHGEMLSDPTDRLPL